MLVELSSATSTRSLPSEGLLAMARLITAIWSSLLLKRLGGGEAKKGWLRPTSRGCWSSTPGAVVWRGASLDTLAAGFRTTSPSNDATLGGRDFMLLDAVLEALSK